MGWALRRSWVVSRPGPVGGTEWLYQSPQSSPDRKLGQRAWMGAMLGANRVGQAARVSLFGVASGGPNSAAAVVPSSDGGSSQPASISSRRVRGWVHLRLLRQRRREWPGKCGNRRPSWIRRHRERWHDGHDVRRPWRRLHEREMLRRSVLCSRPGAPNTAMRCNVRRR